MQTKLFMQNWNSSGRSLFQLLYKSKQGQPLPFKVSNNQVVVTLR